MKSTILKRVICFFCILTVLVGGLSITPAMPVSANQYTELMGTLDILVNKTAEEMEPYKKMFNNRYPGIEVNYIFLEDYEQEATTRIESGDYGDVLFIPDSVSADTYSDYFTILGDSAELSQKYNYIDQAKRINSKIYGLPSCAYISGFLYNKAVFQKAGITELPKTTEEFLQDLQYIKKYTQAVPFYTNYVSEWALNIWEAYPFVDMTGNSTYKYNFFVNEEKPFGKNSTHATVYQLLYDIVKQGLCEKKLENGNWEEAKEKLNSGKIACMAIGSWALKQFKDAGDHSDDVGFMPFPNEVNGKQYATILTDYCYAINKNSTNKEAARAYIDFMLNESGYALANDTISIARRDPFPDAYADMENVVLQYNSIATRANSGKYDLLSTNLNLNDGWEQKRIIDAASGKTKETLDDIFADWNERWESSRTSNMTTNNDIINFSESEVNIGEYDVDFSEEELAYIKNLKSLRIGYLRDFAPFQYTKSGQFDGISREICDIISEQTGITFVYYPYDNYSQMEEALNSHEINFIAGIENISSFSEQIKLSKAYAEFNNVLVKNNSTDIEGLSDKLATAVKGNSLDYFLGLTNITYTKRFSDTLQKVNRGKADYTITNYYSANYYIQDKGLRNVGILPMTSKNGMYLGFPENVDARLVAICNKCIYSIPDSQIELMLLENMEPAVENFSLKQLIERYPLPTIIFLSSLFIIILLVIWWLYREKSKNIRKHALDAKRYKILSDLANEYVFEYNCATNSLIFDKKFKKTFNFSGEINLKYYTHDNENLNLFIANFMELKEQDDLNNKIFAYEHQDGKKVWYRLTVSKIFDEKQHLIQIIGKITNVQKEVEERQAILEKAEKDPLTGLFNREGLYSICNRLLETAPLDGHYAMAVLDLDDFKSVNDSLGHAGGDAALSILAEELKTVFTDAGITARYGGDEFVVYIPNIDSAASVHNMLIRLVTSMDRVMEYNGMEKKLSISLGAVIVDNLQPLDDAFQKADQVLYEVKKAGKNNYQLIKID